MLLKYSSRTGQAHRGITPSVFNTVRKDRRRMVEDIRLMLSISHCTAHIILTEHLKFRKICTLWVPHSLLEEQKLKKVSTSLKLLERYHDEEAMKKDIPHRRFTWDEEIHAYHGSWATANIFP